MDVSKSFFKRSLSFNTCSHQNNVGVKYFNKVDTHVSESLQYIQEDVDDNWTLVFEDGDMKVPKEVGRGGCGTRVLFVPPQKTVASPHPEENFFSQLIRKNTQLFLMSVALFQSLLSHSNIPSSGGFELGGRGGGGTKP